MSSYFWIQYYLKAKGGWTLQETKFTLTHQDLQEYDLISAPDIFFVGSRIYYRQDFSKYYNGRNVRVELGDFGHFLLLRKI